MELINYATFTLTQFLHDEDFVSWVITPTTESNVLLETLITNFPEQKNVVDEARNTILLYREQNVFFNAGRQTDIFKRIESTLGKVASQKDKFKRLPH